MNKIIPIFFILLGILLAPALSDCIGTNFNFTCGETINESCAFNSNLTATATCFNVNGTGIIIDGAGYTLNGDRGTSDYGFNIISDNVTIKNTILWNFGRGIYIFYYNNLNISNNSVYNSSSIGIQYRGNNSIFKNNILINSISTAIHLTFSYNNIISNNIIDGASSCFGLSTSTNYNNFNFNNLSDCTQQGITTTTSSIGNIIKGNIINNTGSDGINIAGANNTIQDNLISNTNLTGIKIRSVWLSAEGNIITNNIINLSKEYGISVQASNNVFSNNKIFNSSYNGIYLINLSAFGSVQNINNTFTNEMACYNNQNATSYYDYFDENILNFETNTTCDTSNPDGICDYDCTGGSLKPSVNINSPADNSFFSYNTTQININWTCDYYNITEELNQSLFVNNNLIYSVNIPAGTYNGTLNVAPEGVYNWYITCSDRFTTSTSEIWSFSVQSDNPIKECLNDTLGICSLLRGLSIGINNIFHYWYYSLTILLITIVIIINIGIIFKSVGEQIQRFINR